MTRKDYELIANVLNQTLEDTRSIWASDPRLLTHGVAMARLNVSRFAQVLAADNPGFDPDKFTRACGF